MEEETGHRYKEIDKSEFFLQYFKQNKLHMSSTNSTSNCFSTPGTPKASISSSTETATGSSTSSALIEDQPSASSSTPPGTSPHWPDRPN